ncbi:MAG: endonuclease [Myxococcaceae bacterium]|nr:endonuclease [Myxococcaceae bacterium]
MRLRIASYNVHGFVGTDGVRDVSRVAAVLRSLDADVIALQEVTFAEGTDASPQPVEISSELSGFQAVGAPITRHDGKPFGNVVLTRMPLLSTRRICLDYAEREPRTALEVVVDTGQQPLRVIATHLGLSPVERRYQVREILQHVAGDEQSVTVLLGDFNEWFLAGRPLRWLHARFGRGPAVRTYPSRFPIFALDRIWVHPQAALSRFGAHTSREARIASDHLPVVAEIAVRGL